MDFLDAASDLMERLHDEVSREWQICNSELSSEAVDEGVIKLELHWHRIPLWDARMDSDETPEAPDVQMRLFQKPKGRVKARKSSI